MIGIFGGTFDPVHWGHLRLAVTVQRALSLSAVRWVPLNQAVHKAQPSADATQRLAMLHAAIQSYPTFCVEPCEVTRGGASYMVDTLAALQTQIPGESLCLLMGADAFASFTDWKQSQRILQLAHLVVAQRPGYSLQFPPELAAHACTAAADLHQQPAGLIYQQAIEPCGFASTLIRQALAAQHDVSAMLPPQVLSFIKQQGLYQSEAVIPC